MTTILAIGIAAFVLVLGVMTFLFLTAPEAYEDQDGFHLGPLPDDKECS